MVIWWFISNYSHFYTIQSQIMKPSDEARKIRKVINLSELPFVFIIS